MVSYNKSTLIFFWVTVVTLIICVVVITIYSGFCHETHKYQALVVTVLLVLLFQYLIGDPIKFLLQAIDAALWPQKQQKFKPDRAAERHTRLEFLKLKLEGQKSKLLITAEHRHEKLNESYRHIARDLWLYGKYFIFLLMVVLVTRDTLLYYNTHFLKEIFYFNNTRIYGVAEMIGIYEVKDFISATLVQLGSSGGFWKYAEQDRLLGVVRLRQLRRNRHVGLASQTFTNLKYMPEWALPYLDLHYKEMYWRVYDPWEPHEPDVNWLSKLLLFIDENGYFDTYPQLWGYVSTLARSEQNSVKILEFLTNYGWFSGATSVIFIDFTMYNVDVNVFSIITLRLESTPFGILLPHADIESVKLMQNLNNLPIFSLLILVIYILVVIQFTKALVLKLWYDLGAINNLWNRLDLVIIILNFIVLVLIIVREWMVSHMIRTVEHSSKMEFIDFRMPAALTTTTTVIIGFLVAVTTLRLWKSLQFASVFKLFSSTLFLAWKALASTAMLIIIFVLAFGVAMDTINGNNSISFNSLVKSIVSCFCFSFGYSSQITPDSLFYGGQIMGILAYLMLAVVLVILLINVFVSLINDYFTTAKSTEDYKAKGRINFLKFLRIEYAYYWKWILRFKCLRKSYHRKNRTVAENVQLKLDEMERNEADKNNRQERISHTEQAIAVDEERLHNHYVMRVEKMIGIGAIFETQLAILSELLFMGRKETGEAQDDEFQFEKQ